MEQKIADRCAWRGVNVFLIGGMLIFAANSVLAGPPDLTGVWERYPPLHDPAATPAGIFAEGFGNPGGEPQLKEPYAKEYEDYQRKAKEADEKGDPLPTPSESCLPFGMPMMMSAIMPLEIVGRAGEVVILAEELAEIRRIHLNEKLPSLQDIPPSFRGYSVGRWEGDTLVVRTAGIREDVRYLDIPHSDEMQILERFRLVSPNMLEDKISIDDPKVLAKKYQVTFRYKRNVTYDVQEYVCTNNHYQISKEGKVLFDLAPQH